ncbi:MAG: metallophosphoesterase [Clostridia bacterium]|nr:metallophosphoesterase [Clostridia bacterium]
MKKILALILCIVMEFSLVACGSGDSTETPAGSDGTIGAGTSENSGGSSAGDSSTDKTPSGGEQTNTVAGAPVFGEEAYNNFKAIMPDKTFVDYLGKASDSKNHVVKDNNTGVYWRYLTFNGLKAGETVNIMQFSDMHLVDVNSEDLKNPITASVYKEHSKSKSGMGLTGLQRIVEYPKYFTATVGTGDNFDYLHLGALEYYKKNIFTIPNSLFTLGNHDVTYNNNGLVSDNTTIESRYDLLSSYWPHDVHYASKIVKDRVMLIQLNNAESKYFPEQLTKLEADIKKAREENLIVFVFQHMPISVNDVNQSRVNAISQGDQPENFRKTLIGGNKFVGDDTTMQVYNMLIGNCDVIKGIFCGHMHADFYTEIHGSYMKDGQKVDAIIPQIVIESNQEMNGFGFAITVK